MRFWMFVVASFVPMLASAQSSGGLPALKEDLATEVTGRADADSREAAERARMDAALDASIGSEATIRAGTDAALQNEVAMLKQSGAGLAAIKAIPLCRGRPGGTCSATKNQSCAYDKDCPDAGETCEWTQPFARFLDNGNGTVTDWRTCLVWEKKTGVQPPGPDPGPQNDADPHDVVNRYTWTTATSAPYLFDGTAKTMFLRQLNEAAFAGHTDWRLPTSGGDAAHPTSNDPELESLLTAASPSCPAGPCIDAVFGPTQAYPYWTSSTYSGHPGYAWMVGFETGYWVPDGKSYLYAVRAVRGGPGGP